MPKLVSSGRIILWGCGCIAAARTIFDVVPWGEAVRFDIDIARPTAPAAERATLLLGGAEAEWALATLLAEPPPSRADTDGDCFPSGIGTIYVKLPLREGLADVAIRGNERRLMMASHVLLELVRRAGLRVDAALHPLGRES